jgi:hypothetical protein
VQVGAALLLLEAALLLPLLEAPLLLALPVLLPPASPPPASLPVDSLLLLALPLLAPLLLALLLAPLLLVLPLLLDLAVLLLDVCVASDPASDPPVAGELLHAATKLIAKAAVACRAMWRERRWFISGSLLNAGGVPAVE